MSILQKSFEWKLILNQIQRGFNNFTFIIIEKFLNEIVYDFISLQIIDLLKFSTNFNKHLQSHVVIAVSFLSVAKFFLKEQIRQNVANFIAFAQMQVKFHYNRKHQSIYFDVKNYALLRFHRDYNISSARFKKLNQ